MYSTTHKSGFIHIETHTAYMTLPFFQPTQRDKHHFNGWFLALVAPFLWEWSRNQHLTNYLAWTRPLLPQLSSSKHCIMTLIRHTQGLLYTEIWRHTYTQLFAYLGNTFLLHLTLPMAGIKSICTHFFWQKDFTHHSTVHRWKDSSLAILSCPM